ncbi:MAG: hypothetical protein LBN97_01490 [Oscillospiraceae bacterium]|jgi:hypothetical protein|nr:hypothetical protein [Oscillospiraceae bacterium]
MKALQITALGPNGRIYEADSCPLFRGAAVAPKNIQRVVIGGEKVMWFKTVCAIDTGAEFDIAGDAGFPEMYTLSPNEAWFMTFSDAMRYGMS